MTDFQFIVANMFNSAIEYFPSTNLAFSLIVFRRIRLSKTLQFQSKGCLSQNVGTEEWKI